MSTDKTTIPRCVVIMAGGRGLRLWPRSNTYAPKQFQNFFGGQILLRQSLSFAATLTLPAQTYVITSFEYMEQTRSLVDKGVHILTEPASRDTAACAGLAALHIERDYPDSIMILLPADHWVGEQETFTRTLNEAVELADAHSCLVTVGVRPTRPETGYGYIKVEQTDSGFYRAKRFQEKPGVNEAKRLIAEGDVFWNTGIFVTKPSTLLSLIRQHMPELGAGLDRISIALDTPEANEVIRIVYNGLTSISLDHGVVERMHDFLVVPAEYPWDDLGSWSAFTRLLPRDGCGNITSGEVRTIDTTSCLVDTPDLKTTLLGVHDLIIVQDGNRLLICNSDRAQDVKLIATTLDTPPTYPKSHIVLKPWGREIWWAVTHAYAGKILEVRAGERLSLQYHSQKLETLFFEHGEGEIILDEKRLSISPGLTVTIEPGTLHQIIARSNLRILEVSTPHLDDVVRVQDIYGRCHEPEENPQ